MQKKNIFVEAFVLTLGLNVILYIARDWVIRFVCPGGGLECLGVGFMVTFFILAGISLLFGVIGLAVERESRLKKAFAYLGIALIASLCAEASYSAARYVLVGRNIQRQTREADQKLQKEMKDHADIWFITPPQLSWTDIDPRIPFEIEVQIKTTAIPPGGALTAKFVVGEQSTVLATATLLPTADSASEGRRVFRGTMPATSLSSYPKGTGEIQVMGTGPVRYNVSVTIL